MTDDEGQAGHETQWFWCCIIDGGLKRSVLFSNVRVETGAVEDTVVLPDSVVVRVLELPKRF